MSADGVEDEKCLEELGCIGRCSIMDAPKVAGEKQRLPPNKVLVPSRAALPSVIRSLPHTVSPSTLPLGHGSAERNALHK